MDVSQYLQIFIEESREHLQNLNDNLLQLENNPENMNILNEIFRAAHTLKGMSGTMGYNNMQKLTHTMESVLAEIRTGNVSVNSKLVDVLFKSLDALENYINVITETGKEGTKEYKALISDLSSLLESKGEKIKNEVKAESRVTNGSITLDSSETEYIKGVLNQGKKVYTINMQIDEGCLLKGARAYLITKNMQDFGEIYKSNPTLKDMEEEKFGFDLSFIVISLDERRVFEEELSSIAEVVKVEVIDFISNVKADDNKNEVKKEKIVTIEAVEENKQDEIDNQDEKTEEKSLDDKKQLSSKTVRVDISRLDNLMNLVSELIIVKTRLEEEVKTSESNEALEYLERVTTNLHDAVMKVRMVPVERVFNRFPRMIRDLAQNLSKSIVLKMTGEDTELDRTVIDEIGEPLIHLLRNAADHGLEIPEERVKSGKVKQGVINLRAYQDGNNVVIEVEDDGKGINYDKVRRKAVEVGAVSAELAVNLSQGELLQLIFAPSFSTADQITNVSGRGVGLDVVKTKIEALGGNVEVKSEVGKGTKFIVRLPLTLAIIQALMVNIGKERYAIPLNIIQTIEDINVTDIKHIQKRETILLRDKVIPIVRLGRELGVSEEKSENKTNTLTIVITKKGERETGFVIDSLIGEQEIVIKSLGKYLASIKMIAGATILGNGEVALILDINMLV
ncbi:MAG TPA: chemotaxis protein CheA [Clostridiales bacterium]|nr:MAG: chemotaxis protein CheA [Clostridiales bacterium GWD2_32_59]HAN10589.1 chemotaxis protein CheA [Clostridiales bacterium]